LQRRVALRLVAADHFGGPAALERFDREQRVAASIHHPSLVTQYATGEWDGGRFVAMRLIRGGTVADLRGRGAPLDREALAPVRAAVGAAHEAGLTHGRIAEHNVMVEPDGSVVLADLGLGRGGEPEADLIDLAALAERLEALFVGGTRLSGTVRLVAAALVLAALGALVLAQTGDEDQAREAEAPAPPAGTIAVGSELSAGDTELRGCSEEPSPNTPACTVAQAGLVVPRAGVVRSWAVRGADGELGLQVIRARGKRAFAAAFSQPERIQGSDPVAYPAEIQVRAGDRIGLRLGPGAQVGVQPGSSEESIVRWDGGLTQTAQKVDLITGGEELMLRADVEFGAEVTGPPQLRGEAAASAPGGRTLDTLHVSLGDGRSARVAVVAVGQRIALDLRRGGRLARLAVPDADPAGELLELVQSCGREGPRGFCMRWRNPGAEFPLQHGYAVAADGRLRLLG
jgi:hypothetical protein